MALTKIRGNQISTATNATVDALAFLDGESSLVIPVGTTAQRPGTATGTTVTVGTMRYNSELNNNGGQAEIYVCLLYTSPSPRDATLSRMPSSA